MAIEYLTNLTFWMACTEKVCPYIQEPPQSHEARHLYVWDGMVRWSDDLDPFHSLKIIRYR